MDSDERARLIDKSVSVMMILLRSYSYSSITIRKLCSLIEISPGTFYSLFPNGKCDLLQVLYDSLPVFRISEYLGSIKYHLNRSDLPKLIVSELVSWSKRFGSVFEAIYDVNREEARNNRIAFRSVFNDAEELSAIFDWIAGFIPKIGAAAKQKLESWLKMCEALIIFERGVGKGYMKNSELFLICIDLFPL